MEPPNAAPNSGGIASAYDLLRQEFAAFEALPAEGTFWLERKEMVRNLEKRVQVGAIALTSEQFQECRNGRLMLGRILAYVLVAYNKTVSDLDARSKDIRDEWLRLQARDLSSDISRMPLHYALEAYLAWLRRNRNFVSDAAADITLLQQIHDALDIRSDRQPKNVVKEIQGFITGTQAATVNPTVAAATINAKYALTGVVITAVVGSFGTAIVSNWDKLRGPKSSPPPVTSSQTSGSAQGSGATLPQPQPSETPRKSIPSNAADVKATGATDQKLSRPEAIELLNEKLRPIYFGLDGYHVEDEQRKQLKEYADLLMKANVKKIIVEGHTDAHSAASNLDLSRARADAVAQYLISYGIPIDKIEVIPYGAERASNEKASAGYNRRVVIRVMD